MSLEQRFSKALKSQRRQSIVAITATLGPAPHKYIVYNVVKRLEVLGYIDIVDSLLEKFALLFNKVRTKSVGDWDLFSTWITARAEDERVDDILGLYIERWRDVPWPVQGILCRIPILVKRLEEMGKGWDLIEVADLYFGVVTKIIGELKYGKTARTVFGDWAWELFVEWCQEKGGLANVFGATTEQLKDKKKVEKWIRIIAMARELAMRNGDIRFADELGSLVSRVGVEVVGKELEEAMKNAG